MKKLTLYELLGTVLIFILLILLLEFNRTSENVRRIWTDEEIMLIYKTGFEAGVNCTLENAVNIPRASSFQIDSINFKNYIKELK